MDGCPDVGAKKELDIRTGREILTRNSWVSLRSLRLRGALLCGRRASHVCNPPRICMRSATSGTTSSTSRRGRARCVAAQEYDGDDEHEFSEDTPTTTSLATCRHGIGVRADAGRVHVERLGGGDERHSAGSGPVFAGGGASTTVAGEKSYFGIGGKST